MAGTSWVGESWAAGNGPRYACLCGWSQESRAVVPLASGSMGVLENRVINRISEDTSWGQWTSKLRLLSRTIPFGDTVG